jgi:subtilisin
MKKIILTALFSVFALAFGQTFFSHTKAQDLFVETSNKSFLSEAASSRNETFGRLINSAQEKGSARVIIELNTNFVPEGNLTDSQVKDQQLSINKAQNELLRSLSFFRVANVKQFEYIPYLAAEVNAEALKQMLNDNQVLSVQEDVIGEPALAESTPIVGANAAWNSGYTGSGQTVAIIDSGVDKNHSFLAGKVISEGCYSSNVAGSSTSVCPGGVTESTASDSGLHCDTAISGCAHGTNVAGIAAGRGTSFSGVAKDANIIAIQVFSRFDSSTSCGTATPCARYWTSDLIRGLERVRTLANTMNNIVAVNMSVQTGQQFTSNCDAAHSATKAAIDNLRSVNIATVICSGNYAFTNALTAPACISSSISVGSTEDGSLGTTLNTVSSFSDSSPLLHLLAPGRWINSSIPNNQFQNYSGTSMAAPHIAGAMAILKQKNPNATIDRMLNVMISTGQPITDSRNGLIKPRLRVDSALQAIANSSFDYDGDGKADVSVFRPSTGGWYVSQSSNNAFFGTTFGNSTDVIAPADFDGDGKTDVSVFRDGNWYRLNSLNNSFAAVNFGVSADLPVPADFDGDGKADISVYRPATGNWYRLNSSNNQFVGVAFGTAEDKPTLGDFDGDGKADVAVFRPSTGSWYRLNSSNGSFTAISFGLATDLPVGADYDGDGKADIAVFRPSNGTWYRLNSSDNSFTGVAFGNSSDKPVAADYDGDGRADIGVFRPSDGTWYQLKSTSGFSAQTFGTNGDSPTPNAFVR